MPYTSSKGKPGYIFPARTAWLIFLLTWMPVLHLNAQLISISARFDTTAIMLGGQTSFTITVDQPEGMHVAFPHLQDTLSASIEILGSMPADTLKTGEERLRITRSYRVTSFYSGEHYVEALPFAFLLEDDEQVLRTRRTAIEVHAPEVDMDSGIFDIKSPFGIPVGIAWVITWILLFILLLAAAWWLFRYLRRRKDAAGMPDEPARAEPAEPAHVTALRELKELKEESLWQKGKIKEYYTRITDIIRKYIERRFGIMTMERTSREIIGDLGSSPEAVNGIAGVLEELLSLADLVKFARAVPGAEEHEAALDTAFRFVKSTSIHPPGTSTAGEHGNEFGSKELNTDG